MLKIKILPQNIICDAEENQLLIDVLSRYNSYFSAPCGGKGVCGKCKVKILAGSVIGGETDEKNVVLSCQARVQSDLTVEVKAVEGNGLSIFTHADFLSEKDGLGIILDIGTTTIAACLVNLKTGETLKKISSLNPQGVYGADVLSRIQACQEGKLQTLQTLILNETQRCIEALAQGSPIKELVVGANTTMLHLFLGVDPKTIGVIPFLPVFTDAKLLKGEELGLQVQTVRLLPSAAAYIGSDVTAGVLACGMHESKNTQLFVDIGTNGEVVLAHNGALYATSTAAGPALEGACIECGIGGISGAIDKVQWIDGKLVTHTIDGVSPKGICGSGLIDAVALFLQEGILDETGMWNDDCSSQLMQYRKDDRFYLTESIYISQRDIRQFQLAKAAISAGIKTLLSECGVEELEVSTTYLAGGLGYYMDLNHALQTGVLPANLKNSLQSVGNSCLSGAHLCLRSDNAQMHIEKLARNIKIIDLSVSPIFQEEYVNNMGFWQE